MTPVLNDCFSSLPHAQRTWGGLFEIWWGGRSFSQCMGEYVAKDSLERGKGGVWGKGLPRKRKISG